MITPDQIKFRKQIESYIDQELQQDGLSNDDELDFFELVFVPYHDPQSHI